MENRRFNIKPEVEKEIVEIVNSGKLSQWNFWFEKVEAADKQFESLWEKFGHLVLEGIAAREPELSLPLLNHIWRNDNYGSVGQGRISESALLEMIDDITLVTSQIYQAKETGIPVGDILEKIPEITTQRGKMHAVRLRALSVMTRLEFPSFYYDEIFREFTNYFGITLRFPNDAPALMNQLAEFLPEQFRSNKYVRFTFPWIIYEELISRKKEGYDFNKNRPGESNEISETSQVQDQKKTGTEQIKNEKKYFWFSIPKAILEKLSELPVERLMQESLVNIPYVFFPGQILEEGDKIYWLNSDGHNVQLIMTVILKRETTFLAIIDQLFLFPLQEEKLRNDPGFEIGKHVLSPQFNEGIQQLNQKEFETIVALNTNQLRRLRAEKSTVASRLHSDGETTEDKLNYRLYATAIAQIIKDERTKPPVNIAIVAPWGHGKTTLMEFLREKFEDRPKWKPKIATGVKMTVKAFYDGIKSMLGKVQTGEKVLETKRLEYPTVWFNPWKYQSSEQIWAGIGHALITQLIGKYEPEEQERIWLRLRLKRIDRNEIRKNIHRRILNSWIPWLAASVIAIVSGIIYSFLKPDNIIAQSTVATGFITAIVSGYLNWKKEQKSEVDGKLADYIREPDYTAKLGVFHEINEDLKIVAGELIDPSKPAIVFIDDLDRCTPKTVAEVFEAVNLMMTGELKDRCYFVIGMDAQMVAAALDTEYNSWSGRLPDQERRHGSVGWYFLDKFIQLPFFIPVMDPKKRKDFISELFRDAQPVKIENNVLPNAVEIQNAATEFVNVKGENVPSMFEVLRNNDPVQFQQVQELVVEKAIEQSKDSVEIDKAISNFSDFLDTSPRGMKRFANLLRFYDSQRIVRRMNAGSLQSEFPEFDVLGRWLVINLRWPQMVRWIQWEREEILLYTVDPEKKAEFIDKMIDEAIRDDETNRFENWKQRLDKLELEKKKHLLWLYDRDLFALLTSNASPDASLKKALECDVW